jgi:hypothetical protein
VDAAVDHELDKGVAGRTIEEDVREAVGAGL